ncbi:hypothetical protein N431DRAFT_451024 [Stipitochalara longipes BDJ]|nr:hypothetical protein N431DRAFT_451024 [Stipitochalara longipes BDJ]
MASSTSTPTRRVLSDLNINTPTARGAMQSFKLGASGVAKPPQLGEIYLQTDIHKDAGTVPIYTEAHVACRKRNSETDADELPNKRFKTSPSPSIDREEVLPNARHGQTIGGGNRGAAVLQSPLSRPTVVFDNAASSSATSSPTSSLGSRQAGLDDSQNTTITEPDDVPIFIPTIARPVSVRLTMEEIRERAEVLKLRLKLASYKVRTNQIDIPISRLQIKTLSSTSPELPRHPRLANSSQRRIPLPATATALPDIRLQTPSAEKRRPYHARIPSSPPPYLEVTNHKSGSPIKETDTRRAGESEGCTTPLLPRQRQGMLNPPTLGSPIWAEATSSVVKSRAACGLLELMRQQN